MSGRDLEHDAVLLLDEEILESRSIEMARGITDDTCQWECPVQVSGKRVQHLHLSRPIQHEHGPLISRATELSGAVQISSRVRNETAIRCPSILPGERVQDGVDTVTGNLEHDPVAGISADG